MSNIKKGQILYRRDYGKPEMKEVFKVGHKWITFTDGKRCDANTMIMENYGGDVFLSLDALNAQNQLDKDQYDLVEALRTKKLSRHQIDKIAEIAWIKL